MIFYVVAGIVCGILFNRVAHLRRAKSLLYVIATDMKRLAALSQDFNRPRVNLKVVV